MKIAVAGATGRVGRPLVEVLRAGGHEDGVDLITGKGVAEALVGVECVIDASGGGSADQKAATDFFTMTRPARPPPAITTSAWYERSLFTFASSPSRPAPGRQPPQAARLDSTNGGSLSRSAGAWERARQEAPNASAGAASAGSRSVSGAGLLMP